MRDTKIDAILTSSAPETSHLVACELTKEFHTPWLADFRDLWVLNHNYPYNRIRKMFEKRLEIRTMRLADALVTVSKPLSEKQASLHQCEKLDTEGSDVKVRKKVFTIPNGFDPELIPRDVHLTKNLTITYTGQFYEKQHPERLFFALCDMMRSVILSKQLEIRIYGRFDERVERLVERSGIRKLYGEDVVRQYGKVSREEALKKQKESQILWLTQFEDEKESGMLGTKIFEYLGASRPILFTGSFVDSVVKDLLDETNAGFYCSNEREIKNALQGFYVEYESKGAVSYKGNMSKINEYSHLEMARKFAEALDSVVGKRK
jgi:glycosyltransferase involved in cell wall biosynthesis